jgi:hypothetical protein
VAYIRIDLSIKSDILNIESIIETLNLLSNECNFRDNNKDKFVISSDMLKSFSIDKEILNFSKLFDKKIALIKEIVDKYQAELLLISYVETSVDVEVELSLSPESSKFINAIGARFEIEFLFDERYSTNSYIRTV